MLGSWVRAPNGSLHKRLWPLVSFNTFGILTQGFFKYEASLRAEREPQTDHKEETKATEYQRLSFFAFLFCPFFVPLCSLLLYLPVLNSKFIGGEADADLHHLAPVGLIWDGITFRVNLVKSLLGGTIDL